MYTHCNDQSEVAEVQWYCKKRLAFVKVRATKGQTRDPQGRESNKVAD